MKPILPSLRERKRYMAYEIISNESHAFENAARAINESYRQLFGEQGMAEANISAMKADFHDNKGIIRMNHKATDRAKMAIAMIKNIGKSKATARSTTVSGTLKKAKSKLKR